MLGGRGFPSRKASYCSRVSTGGVITGKSNERGGGLVYEKEEKQEKDSPVPF